MDDPDSVILLVLAAACAGFSKTSIGGLGVVSTALAAVVMSAQEGTALVLLFLLVGDAIAVVHYRKGVDVTLLRNLVPGVLPGLAVGAWLLAVLSAEIMRRTIAIVLLVLVAMQLLMGRKRVRLGVTASRATGTVAGTTTMVANAGGPVMTLYLIAHGVDKRTFLGTTAWVFLGINLCKVPFVVWLGLFTREILQQFLVLAPVVVCGALIGIAVAGRLRQRLFELVVLVAGGASAAALLFT